MGSNSLDIPLEDLTQDRLEQWWALPTDRQRFVWALQTETRVRAHKVQNRDITPTLQSDLLFELYLPAPSALGRDTKRHVSLYHRKVNAAVFGNHTQGRAPDAEFDTTVYPLDLTPTTPLGYDAPLAPPNMLFFEIILEAYCGYSMQRYYHPIGTTLPRAAIMGGAIVAVLVSWRDPKVKEMKEWEELDNWMSNPKSDQDSYETIAEKLLIQLQDYFYDKKSTPFAAGDLDIFLQPSPLTRSLTSHLAQHGMDDKLLKRVSEFMGGFEFCESDLEDMSTVLCDMLVPAFEDIGPFIYSATQRGISFALSRDYDRTRNRQPWGWIEKAIWPRNTQLIMLSERADLLGALFDFDISVAAFAYDGIHVRAAPRAVLSLVTNVLVVTPFVLAEKRNRQRIFKYCKRGFRPYMLDPYCNHLKQCRHDCCDMDNPTAPKDEDESMDEEDSMDEIDGRWESRYLDPENARDNPKNYYDRRTNVCECLYSKDTEDRDTDEYEWDKMFKYTFGVVAKTEPHLFEFLASKNKWSPEHQAFVRSIHPMARKICRHCREAYMDYIVLKACPPDFADSMDELLHGEKSYRRGGFYSGGAFNSTKVRDDAISDNRYLSLLRAQEIAEETKHLIRHGSYDDYKPRFAYGDELETLLQEASKISFAEPNRRPLGLNPERFMADCEHCRKEMPGREYGTKICEECETRVRTSPAKRKRHRSSRDKEVSTD